MAHQVLHYEPSQAAILAAGTLLTYCSKVQVHFTVSQATLRVLDFQLLTQLSRCRLPLRAEAARLVQDRGSQFLVVCDMRLGFATLSVRADFRPQVQQCYKAEPLIQHRRILNPPTICRSQTRRIVLLYAEGTIKNVGFRCLEEGVRVGTIKTSEHERLSFVGQFPVLECEYASLTLANATASLRGFTACGTTFDFKIKAVLPKPYAKFKVLTGHILFWDESQIAFYSRALQPLKTFSFSQPSCSISVKGYYLVSGSEETIFLDSTLSIVATSHSRALILQSLDQHRVIGFGSICNTVYFKLDGLRLIEIKRVQHPGEVQQLLRVGNRLAVLSETVDKFKLSEVKTGREEKSVCSRRYEGQQITRVLQAFPGSRQVVVALQSVSQLLDVGEDGLRLLNEVDDLLLHCNRHVMVGRRYRHFVEWDATFDSVRFIRRVVVQTWSAAQNLETMALLEERQVLLCPKDLSCVIRIVPVSGPVTAFTLCRNNDFLMAFFGQNGFTIINQKGNSTLVQTQIEGTITSLLQHDQVLFIGLEDGRILSQGIYYQLGHQACFLTAGHNGSVLMQTGNNSYQLAGQKQTLIAQGCCSVAPYCAGKYLVAKGNTLAIIQTGQTIQKAVLSLGSSPEWAIYAECEGVLYKAVKNAIYRVSPFKKLGATPVQTPLSFRVFKHGHLTVGNTMEGQSVVYVQRGCLFNRVTLQEQVLSGWWLSKDGIIVLSQEKVTIFSCEQRPEIRLLEIKQKFVLGLKVHPCAFSLSGSGEWLAVHDPQTQLVLLQVSPRELTVGKVCTLLVGQEMSQLAFLGESLLLADQTREIKVYSIVKHISNYSLELASTTDLGQRVSAFSPQYGRDRPRVAFGTDHGSIGSIVEVSSTQARILRKYEEAAAQSEPRAGRDELLDGRTLRQAWERRASEQMRRRVAQRGGIEEEEQLLREAARWWRSDYQ